MKFSKPTTILIHAVVSTIAIFTITAYGADNSKSFDNLTRVIPEDLFVYGIKNNCLQVTDFYKNRAQVDHPPFVYGLHTFISGDVSDDSSAAFWCQPINGNSGEYTLMFNFNGGNQGMGQCPNRIDKRDHIGGLSIIKDLDEPLNLYYDVITQKFFKSSNEKAKGVALKSEYDGEGSIYYCYKGHWLTRELD